MVSHLTTTTFLRLLLSVGVSDDLSAQNLFAFFAGQAFGVCWAFILDEGTIVAYLVTIIA